MNECLQERHTARRVPDGPIRLAPPLAFRWELKGGRSSVGLPVVRGDHTLALRGERFDAVCLDADGKERWRLPLGCGHMAIVGGAVLVQITRKGSSGLMLADLDTGRPGWEDMEAAGFTAVLPGRGFIERHYPEPMARLRGASEGFPILWSHRFGAPRVTDLDVWSACDEERAFFSVREGDDCRVVALGIADGQERWTRAVNPIDKPQDAHRWNPAVAAERLIFGTEGGTVALRTRDGRLAWRTTITGSRSVYGDKVYLRGANTDLPGWPSRIVVLDARTGREHWRRDYPEVLKKGRENRLTGHLAVSETHLFCGDGDGRVWAFDARTGEPVWNHRVDRRDAFAPWALPVAVDGRLYIASTGARDYLYCYEQAPRAGGRAEEEEPDDADGRLPFTIDEVQRRRRITRARPFSASGGCFTVMACRAGDRGRFFLAVDERHGGDAYLWAADAAAGAALLGTVRNAFPVRGVVKAAARVRPPVSMDAAILGKGVGEHGAGKGTWTLSKWTGADGVPEVYVNWSLADKRGAIVEKDESCRKALVRLIAGLAPARPRPVR